MTHRIATIFRFSWQRLVDLHSPTARSSTIKLVTVHHFGTMPHFDRHLTVVGMHRFTAFDHTHKNTGRMARAASTPCGMETYDIMATKTGPHAVSTILPIA